MSHQPLTVAVPWGLSHYIALNGFHPLYRALFDEVPASVEFHAWDNVKLHNRFSQDIEIRTAVLSAANAAKHKAKHLVTGSVASAYQDFFWAPNQALTSELMGDIEFHHTAPFPSLERPFVFHCESFSPIFSPFSQQGGGEFEKTEEIREYYRGLFSNPLCLGIFSHIPETLASLNCFFSDPIIESKLFSSRIGLSSKAFADPGLSEKSVLSVPKFLFINSAHQNPANFFRRGGHLVLRFWKEFKKTGRDGLLMMRCEKPSESELLEHGVDVSFLSAELGHSILWAKDYLATHEMDALMASAHFFLLPSMSLHSASIMHAMALGAVPVVTDTVGTSVYVMDDENGIVLQGIRSAIWDIDLNTGVLFDNYSRMGDVDDSLVSQMTHRIFALLNAPETFQKMKTRLIDHARLQFSGEVFASDFWSSVDNLYQTYKRSFPQRDSAPRKIAPSLMDCTIQGDDWARVFENPTQPMQKIHTGQGTVWEFGGAVIHAYGRPSFSLRDWSVFAQYYNLDSPRITFASSLDALGGKYLSIDKIYGYHGALSPRNRKLINFISRVLMPYPQLHSFGVSVLKKMARYRAIFQLYCQFRAFRNGKGVEADVELIFSGVQGYNIIRCFHKFVAIPQGEGAFDLEKVSLKQYSSIFWGYSADKVVSKVTKSQQFSKNKNDAKL
jgi:glycosyltransferase involved in cell wall biosynthesis